MITRFLILLVTLVTAVAQESGWNLKVYTNIADMKANASPKSSANTVRVLGYFNPGDGGGGDFKSTNSVSGQDEGMRFSSDLAVATHSWDRLADTAVINAKWFGAGLLGVTDDTPRIQAAINVATAPAATSRRLRIPASTYNIDATTLLVSGARGFIISGDGGESTILNVTGPMAGAVLKFYNCQEFELSNLAIYCNKKADRGIFFDGINTPPNSIGRIVNVVVVGAINEGVMVNDDAVNNYQGDHLLFDTCNFYQSKYNYVQNSSNALENKFLNCQFSGFGANNPDYNIWVKSGGVRVLGVSMYHSVLYDIRLGVGTFFHLDNGYSESERILITDSHANFQYPTVIRNFLHQRNYDGDAIIWDRNGLLTLDSCRWGGSININQVLGGVVVNNNFRKNYTFTGNATAVGKLANIQSVFADDGTGANTTSIALPFRANAVRFGALEGSGLLYENATDLIYQANDNKGMLFYLGGTNATLQLAPTGAKVNGSLNMPIQTPNTVALFDGGRNLISGPPSSAIVSGGANLGATGVGIFAGQTGNILGFNTVQSGGNLTISSNQNVLTFTVPGPGVNAPTSFDTVQNLLDSPTATASKMATVNRRSNSVGNGVGGGIFFYDAASVATVDGGTIFAPTVGGGRWFRVYSGPLDAQWFGVVGDGVTDDYSTITNTLVTIGSARTLYFPRNTYALTKPLIITSEAILIKGDGPTWTRFRHIGTTPVDTVIEMRSIAAPNHAYYMNLADLSIEGNAFTTNALRLTRVAHSTYDRLTLGGAAHSYLRVDGTVLATFNDLRVSHQIGISSGPVPKHNIYLDGVAAGEYFSNSLIFNGVIAEGASDYGIVLTNGTCQTVWIGGTVEAGNKGIQVTHNSSGNSFTGIDMERNTGLDLVVEDLANHNTFNAILGTQGARFDSYGSSIVGGRFGDVTFTSGSVNNNAIGTMYNVLGNGKTWTDAGSQNTWIGRFNGSTAARDSRYHIETPQTLIRSPMRVVGSDWDTNYALFFNARVSGPGAINFDVIRHNGGGVGFQTNFTFGLWGNASAGYPNITDTDAKFSVNGGLNVGSSVNPGFGFLAAENLNLRLRTPNTMAVWDGGRNLVSGPATASLVTTARTITTTGSLQGGGSLANDLTLQLVNDNGAPGASRYYGTDTSGTKGFFPVVRYIALSLSDPNVTTMTAPKTNFISLPQGFVITKVTGKLLNAGTSGTTLTLRNGVGGAVITSVVLNSGEVTKASGVLSTAIAADAFVLGELTSTGTGTPYGAQLVISYTFQ